MPVPKPYNPPMFAVAPRPDSPSSISEEMVCPVGQEVMFDPVIDKYGHTYERHIIVKAISVTGRSPLTNEPLSSSDPLVPNRSLRNLIERHPEAAREAAAARRDYEKEQNLRPQPAAASAAAGPRATRPSYLPADDSSFVELDVMDDFAAAEVPSSLDINLRRSQRDQLRHQLSPQPLPPCTAPQHRAVREAFGRAMGLNSGLPAVAGDIFAQHSARPSAPPLPWTLTLPSAPPMPWTLRLPTAPSAPSAPNAPSAPRVAPQRDSAARSHPRFQPQHPGTANAPPCGTAGYSSAELQVLGSSGLRPATMAEYNSAELQRVTEARLNLSAVPRRPHNGAHSIFKIAHQRPGAGPQDLLMAPQDLIFNPGEWVPYTPARRKGGALKRVFSSPASRVDYALLQWLPLVSGSASRAAAQACREDHDLSTPGSMDWRPDIKELPFTKAIHKWYRSCSPFLLCNLPYRAATILVRVYVKHLPVLDLSNLDLKSLPRCISELTWLKEVYLHGNQLAEVPAFLGQLPHLEKVTLYGNRFLAQNDPYALSCPA
jgi:hypothetical protein